MRLNEIQNRFRNMMLDHPKALDDPPGDFAALFEAGAIPLPARLKVYRNNIVGTLSDVMIATFPTVEKLVGREFLEGMARSFVLENPPVHGCLNTYGEGFNGFIAGFGPAKSLPYLPDVARLDLAMNRAYYAADDEMLAPSALGAVPPEELPNVTLKLRASAQLLSSVYPLEDIRAFCFDNDDPDKTLDIGTGGVKLMIFRPHLDTMVVRLADCEYAMLRALADGKPLGAALEGTLEDHPAFDFQAFLARHIGLETFAAQSAN